jgi:hypothetical protein
MKTLHTTGMGKGKMESRIIKRNVDECGENPAPRTPLGMLNGVTLCGYTNCEL